MSTAIFSPGLFVVPSIERTLLAIGYGANSSGCNSQRAQVISSGVGPFVSKSDIVLGSSTLIAMSFDEDSDTGNFCRENIGVLSEIRLGLRSQIIPVEIVKHILYLGFKDLFHRQRLFINFGRVRLPGCIQSPEDGNLRLGTSNPGRPVRNSGVR